MPRLRSTVVKNLANGCHTFERHGDCVVVHGSLRRFREGGFLDVQPSWVLFYREGRLVAATAYASRAEAIEQDMRKANLLGDRGRSRFDRLRALSGRLFGRAATTPDSSLQETHA